MQRANLDLQDFRLPWERKITDGVNETEFERLLRGDVNLVVTPSGQHVFGYTRPLAQDVFGALVIRQRGA